MGYDTGAFDEIDVPGVWQMAGFCTAGFLLVMFVLAFQSILTALIGKFFTTFENSKK